MGDELAGFAGLSVRTLAISQLLPTTVLIWLPTWPDMATDGSACDCIAATVAASMRICDPEPAISTTVPIAPGAGPAGLGRRGGRFILLEAADFIEEFVQVRPVVHMLRLLPVLGFEPGISKSG